MGPPSCCTRPQPTVTSGILLRVSPRQSPSSDCGEDRRLRDKVEHYQGAFRNGQWGTMTGAVFRGVLLTALVAQPRA